MRSVNPAIVGTNDYNTPLQGTPYYRNCGVIYATTKQDKYAVGHIAYERFDEQNFQYVIKPEWSVIDALPSAIFQGIPGLDMSLRAEAYYRVNLTPYFIQERTPSESREDLWELLEAVGLDYYDRFEWLLRANVTCGIDNLIVERAMESRRISAAEEEAVENVQPTDVIVIEDFASLASTPVKLKKKMLRILSTGAQIYLKAEARMLSEEECSVMLRLLLAQQTVGNNETRKRREEGIKTAKEQGRYRGRRSIAVDKHLLKLAVDEMRSGLIDEQTAMQRAGIKSRSTFYRRVKELDT